MEPVKQISCMYPGRVPVYMKLQDEGIALLLSSEYWCDGCGEVLGRFRELFGQDGVVVRE